MTAEIRPIRVDADHAAAMEEIGALWGAAPGSPEGDRLDVLVTLVEAYEAAGDQHNSLETQALLVWASAAWLSANVEAMAAMKIEMRIV